MYKISIIVPVYGVEKYIERCARSLFEQTLKEIEYIFVNDGTKDRSIDVLKSVLKDYPDRIPHVKILEHEINRGLPKARQTGISASTGDYLIHCDSDDWLELCACEKAYDAAIANNADMVIYNFYDNDGVRATKRYEELINTPSNLFFLYISIWSRLTKRTVYNNSIVYPEGGMFEDRVLSLQLTFYAHNVYLLNEPLYNYYNNASSMCRVFSEEKCFVRWEQAVGNTGIVLDFLNRKGLINDYAKEVLRLKYITKHQLAPIVNKKDYYQQWKNCYPEIGLNVLFSNGLSLSDKIRFVLTYLKLFPRFKAAN